MVLTNQLANKLISPHGGQLVSCLLRGDMRKAVQEKAKSLVALNLSPPQLSNLELIATGALTPLTGFMNRAEYESVLMEMRLTNGLVWTMPVTCRVDEESAASIQIDQEIALAENGRILAVMEVTDKFQADKLREAELIFQTRDSSHPGVATLIKHGDFLLGGRVWAVDLPGSMPRPFSHLHYTPAQTRRMFGRRGWRRVVGVHSDGPPYRTHEYMHKTALELVDGLFIHPAAFSLIEQSFPAELTIGSHKIALGTYYPVENVLLGVFPSMTRFAGPREAVHHALIHKNYGCSHFVVPFDHAALGHYYRPYDAQRIFEHFSREELGIDPIPFDKIVYCHACQAVVSVKTCPHRQKTHQTIQDEQLFDQIKHDQELPMDLIRPEVARFLAEGLQLQSEPPLQVATL